MPVPAVNVPPEFTPVPDQVPPAGRPENVRIEPGQTDVSAPAFAVRVIILVLIPFENTWLLVRQFPVTVNRTRTESFEVKLVKINDDVVWLTICVVFRNHAYCGFVPPFGMANAVNVIGSPVQEVSLSALDSIVATGVLGIFTVMVICEEVSTFGLPQDKDEVKITLNRLPVARLLVE